ncbi:MAG TPA: hypothetical protein DCE05_00710 [Microbacteriaceae bacterium]|nr:hypothetical protein [Microbacteriaceae bacterium]
MLLPLGRRWRRSAGGPRGATLDTPAKRWGVDSGLPHVLLAGASAIRGGGVSAIGGHNAAMATLEVLRES